MARNCSGVGPQTAALVRIPAFRREYVQRVLDYGGDGILLPMMESAAQAREFAAAMRYPPHGTRGMTGIFRASGYNRELESYLAQADEKLLCAVQIESAAGVDHVEEIAAVDGIKCGPKPTSCPDQLAQALKEIKAQMPDGKAEA